MKKTISIVILLVFATLVAAQNTTYRQNLKQEVNHLVVSGNCIVRLQQDTCNWIAYTGEAPSGEERLVTIEGNKLTTTTAANDMTLTVGTTAGSDSAHYHLTFDVSDNGLVLYDGKVHAQGRTTIDGYDSSKRNLSARKGKKKYDESHRMHNDFFFGYNQWLTGDGRINDPIQGKSLLETGWQISYSIYMDDHIAAGIGAEIHTSNYLFRNPNVVFSSEEGVFSMDSYNSSAAGTWTSVINTASIDLPLHFIYYPNARKHTFSLRLELIPQFTFSSYHSRNYTFQQNDEEVITNYNKEIPFNRFQLKSRLTFNYGLVGAYLETGLTPLFKELNIDSQRTITPYHFALGLRINLFSLLTD